MEIIMKPTVDGWAVAREVEEKYGMEPGTLNMIEMFGRMCDNDSWQEIRFDEDAYEDLEEDMECYPEDEETWQQKKLVMDYLHENLPELNCVLWLCTW